RNRRAQPDRRLGGGVGALGVWEEDPVKGSKRLSRRARLVWDLHPNQNIWTTCANFDGAGLGGQGCKQAIKLELFGAGRGSRTPKTRRSADLSSPQRIFQRLSVVCTN